MAAHTHHLTTGLGLWLELAKASAQKILDGRVELGGAYFFPNHFDWQGHAGDLMKAPWYSGMAQGEALSVFVQMAAEFPDEPRWREAAEATFASLLVPWGGAEPAVTHAVDGFLWFEEYACPNPYQVLNGHIFALFGVYEYWNATKDPVALELFDGAITTALYAAELARSPGAGSFYCVNPDICLATEWRSATYHPIHIAQFRMLAQMAGEPRFDDWARAYASDKPEVKPWRVAALWPGAGAPPQ
ncbi:MAG: D-glucuronyl C5-epimerase family protein [Bifidobacteriaceae bacterium]|nr:D-glucuronyl C5-epimerase family protein [Bifidobacteriaceae bacterium]